jgi:hypothetical protein
MPFNFKTADGFYSTWKEGSAAYVRDEDRWKKVTSGYMKVNGVWEPFFIAQKGNVKNLQTVTTNDNITFTWDAAEDIKEYEVWVSKTERGILTANYVKVDHLPLTTPAIDNFLSNVVSTTNKIILQSGSKTVTGVSTTFLSTLKVGNILYVTIDSIRTFVGVIQSIQSNTSLTLKNAWTGLDIGTPGINMIYQTHNTYTYATDREFQYYFYFVPIDINNIAADQSPITSRITPDKVPAVPAIVVNGNAKTGSATLSWSPDIRAVRYALYWNSADGTNNLTLKEYFTPSPTSGEYTAMFNTKTNGVYKVAIAAINNINEESAKSNVVEYTYSPVDTRTLAKPVLNATASSWDRATFSWANILNAGRYELFVNNVSKGTVTSPYTLVGVKNTTYAVYVKVHGAYDPNAEYTNSPESSNTKTLTTGFPETTTTVRTDGSDFLDYQGTNASFLRYRYTSTRRNSSSPFGNYVQSGPFPGNETVGPYSPGTGYPRSRTTGVSQVGNTRTYDYYEYTNFRSTFFKNFNNNWNMGRISTTNTSGNLSLSGGTGAGNQVSATTNQNFRGTRPTVSVTYWFNTNTTVAGKNAAIT